MDSLNIPAHVANHLGYYVYVYIDPRNGLPFYIGKGKNGRVLDHMGDVGESEKHQLISDIRSEGADPIIEILMHNIKDEKTALTVECAAIDLIGLQKLTNKVRGNHSREFGRMTLQHLVGHYTAEPVTFDHKVILIRINQTFRHNMSPEELYEATRGTWGLGDRKEFADYALPVFQGVTKELYKIDSWHPGGSTEYWTRAMIPDDRVEFKGHIDNTELRQMYINRDVVKYYKRGNPRSCIYVNF